MSRLVEHITSLCTMIGMALVCMVATGLAAEVAYRSSEPIRRYLGSHVDELPAVPLNKWLQPDLKQYPACAIFLYNATIESHHEFLHDVRVANAGHKVPAFEMDCTDGDDYKRLCGQYGHGEIHKNEEPPMIFFHRGEWSESYHDDLQQGKVPKPESRHQRVKHIISWLDKAAARAQKRIRERESMLASASSPLDRMKAEYGEEEAWKRVREQAVKDGAGKKGEL